MRSVTVLALALAGPLAAAVGCRNDQPPPRVAVPLPGQRPGYEHDPVRPLPPPSYSDVGTVPHYDDQPLLNDRPPEQGAFVDAYRQVGGPRIAVFVNRTLEGQVLPVTQQGPVASVEHVRRSTTGLSVERRTSEYQGQSYYRDRETSRTDRFESTGPGEYRETTDLYLRPGEYDEVAARAIDYEAMEAILTDWIASNGQVAVVSPTMARQRLTDEQLADLESGRPQVLAEVAQQLDADVLVQVQAKPTRQTQEGLEVRVIAEAFNTRGGESLARAVLDLDPPLTKQKLNGATRWIARKLMDDMTYAWSAPAPMQGPASQEQSRQQQDLQQQLQLPEPRQASQPQLPPQQEQTPPQQPMQVEPLPPQP